MKPTLTVWMPNYNHAKYIGRAIEAIVTQTVLPDELVIIDDASEDDGKKIIENYSKKYSWIRPIYLQKNIGVLAIMEKGVAEIATDYVCMSAADDYILPRFFEEAMNGAREHLKAGIVFGQMRCESEKGRYLYTGKASMWQTSAYITPQEYLEKYLKKEAVTQSLSAATIYRMSALREVGGFKKDLGAWCDTFAIHAMALKYGAYYIANPVATWAVHTASVSQGVRSHPSKMLAVIRHAEQLMENNQFHSLFPPSYVRIWALKYRMAVLVQYIIAISPRWLQKWYFSVIHKFA